MLNNRNLDPGAGARDAGDPDMLEQHVSPFAFVPPASTPGPGGGNGGGDACGLVTVHLSAYQDRELDPDQRRVVEAHLSQCPVCAANLDAIQRTDAMLQREWRDAPLPSSLQRKRALDSIMEALPPAPEAVPAFAPKRVHARTRWMRFSTGLAGVLAFTGLMGSSYYLGYRNGRMSILSSMTPSPSISPDGRHSLNPTLSSATFRFAPLTVFAPFASAPPPNAPPPTFRPPSP